MSFRRHHAQSGPESLASFAARARRFIAQHVQPSALIGVQPMPADGVWASGPAISAQDRTIVLAAEGHPGSDGYPYAVLYAPSHLLADLGSRIGASCSVYPPFAELVRGSPCEEQGYAPKDVCGFEPCDEIGGQPAVGWVLFGSGSRAPLRCMNGAQYLEPAQGGDPRF